MKHALALTLLSLFAACGDNNPTQPEAICGDGVVQGTEACDDGNSIDGDSCSNECKMPGCGDGIVNFTEACDDGNMVNGDGCDNNCTQSFCGNGIKSDDEACDDGNTVSGDGCDNNCKPTGCGNGQVVAPETCDDGNMTDGDGCDSNCTLSACGNGVKAGTEQCDDGNTTSADGCSATCATETAEVEPNDDGMIATGASGINGNDFSITAPDANGAITNTVTITASLNPVGDEDIFKLQNTGTKPVRVNLDTWNLATGFGIGTSCGLSSIDTGLQVKNAAGVLLASNDDRNSSSDNCSSLIIALFPGDVVYVQVVEFGDNAAIPLYALDIKFKQSVCGDGDVGPGEQCDDMNTTSNDGCSATCSIEGAYTEVEPNEDGTPSTGGSGIVGNDFATTNALNNGSLTANIVVLGALNPLGDEDVFAFTNVKSNNIKVTFDTWNLGPGFGIGAPCGTALDTGLTVRDAAGTSLASNNDRVSTTDQCSKVTVSLQPGDVRFLHVVENGDNATAASYALVAKFEDIVCGNGMVELGETCDDGNTTSGDNCSSTCQVEPFCGDSILQPGEQCDDGNTVNGDNCNASCQVEGATSEIEPNEDGTPQTGGSTLVGNDFATAAADANGAYTGSGRIVGSFLPAGDEDVYAFRNTSSTFVLAQFNVWSNLVGHGIGVSTTSVDPVMQIRDASGLQLALNDDTNGFLPAIGYAIAPGQTIYVYVFDRGDDTTLASYTLETTYTPFPGFNTAVAESEPNEDGAIATGGSGINGNDFSSANANGPFSTSKRIVGRLREQVSSTSLGDEDVYAFTNSGTGPVIARFDMWNMAINFGIGVACGTTINPGLQIRNATGTSLASNDDRNGSSDRCPGLTFTLAAGQTVYAHVMASGDSSKIENYILDVVYTPIVCGDGTVAPGEQCDDGNTTSGDGCSATCQLEVVCGNGVLQAGEECDDANTANGDGCSMTCTIENKSAEVEPNNTSADADASTVHITGNAFVSGAITPAGDVDRYKVTVATSTVVRFEAFTTYGDCSTATIDLRLFDSTSTQIAADTGGTGINECGALTYFLMAGTYYVQVEERGNNGTVAAYLLQAAFQTDSGTETEPNETTAQASSNIANKTDTFVFANHMTAGDVDTYAITVPPGGRVRAEIIEGNAAMETCESAGVDSRIQLFDDTGAVIGDDNDAGRGLCSLIDGTGTTPLDPTAKNTSSTTKTYYVQVTSSPFATSGGAQFSYRLQVTIR